MDNGAFVTSNGETNDAAVSVDMITAVSHQPSGATSGQTSGPTSRPLPYAGMGKDELLLLCGSAFWKRLRMACLVGVVSAWVAMTIATVMLTAKLPRCSAPDQQRSWWQNGVLYQVFVPSYFDSDGDGVGDVRGLEAKIDYIRSLDVDGLILSSVCPSQGGSTCRDWGYECSDFLAVGSEFGTTDDFVSLLRSAHSRGIKVIMEFVPNHTGTGHEWFIKSRRRRRGNATSRHEDYYVWKECAAGVPNNWLSVYGNSSWTYDDERGECFLHQFFDSQPDLNLSNPHVLRELDDILRFWLSLGVDGFRVRSVRHLYEDEQLRDEPARTGCSLPVTQYDCLEHTRTTSLPDSFELIARWRALLEEFSQRTGRERLLLTDAHESSVDDTVRYHVSGRGSQLSINYQLTRVTPFCDGGCLKKFVDDWLIALPADASSNWLIGHQDEPRVSTETSPQFAKAMTVLLLTLPGVALSYYGDELGMRNGHVTPPGDPAAHYRYRSRTPMQWSDRQFAGFVNTTVARWRNDSQAPWLPVNDDYVWRNVKTLTEDSGEMSELSLFRDLTRLRRAQPSMRAGTIRYALVTSRVFAFVRELPGQKKFLVAINVGNTTSVDDYRQDAGSVPSHADLHLSTSSASRMRVGDRIAMHAVTLVGGEAAIFQWP